MEAPWDAPKAKEWDSMTVKEFLDKNVVTFILCEKQVIIVFKKNIDDSIVVIDKLLLNSHNLRFLITMLRRRWDSNQKVIVTLATED
jgi:hypothetical protein